MASASLERLVPSPPLSPRDRQEAEPAAEFPCTGSPHPLLPPARLEESETS